MYPPPNSRRQCGIFCTVFNDTLTFFTLSPYEADKLSCGWTCFTFDNEEFGHEITIYCT